MYVFIIDNSYNVMWFDSLPLLLFWKTADADRQ